VEVPPIHREERPYDKAAPAVGAPHTANAPTIGSRAVQMPQAASYRRSSRLGNAAATARPGSAAGQDD